MAFDNPRGSNEAESLVQSMQQQREAEPEPQDGPTGGSDDDPDTPDPVEPEPEPVEPEENPDYEDPDEGGEYEEYDDPDSDPEPRTYTVKVNGKEQSVTEDELVSGYQRDSDYRQKTMELAEQRKSLEAKAQELESTVSTLKSFIEEQDQKIDWDELRETDPSEYLKQKELQDKRQKALKEAEEKRQGERQQQMQQVIARERDNLINAMGGDKWQKERMQKDMGDAVKFLKGQGFSDEQIDGVYDHRIWKMAINNARYEQLMQNKRKVGKQVKKAPRTTKPGGQRPAPSQRAEQEAAEKLKGATKHNQTQALVEAMKSRRGK